MSFSLVPDTDTVPTALDAGTTGAQAPRILGWFDGDGDYGFVADDLVFTTPAGQVTIDHLTLQGTVADDLAVATAVRGWWAQALTEGAAGATPVTTTPSTPAPTPALVAAP
ncbi:hypothetical protein [Pedococcus dokdonensis]|uniref:hypothetical protein n=1 Tax=Pedococcus dokdonensis TaxID=443156 RepID=UPI000A9E8805|nr:hypothetical protein [Pedococcus dokdonensis]